MAEARERRNERLRQVHALVDDRSARVIVQEVLSASICVHLRLNPREISGSETVVTALPPPHLPPFPPHPRFPSRPAPPPPLTLRAEANMPSQLKSETARTNGAKSRGP